MKVARILRQRAQPVPYAIGENARRRSGGACKLSRIGTQKRNDRGVATDKPIVRYYAPNDGAGVLVRLTPEDSGADDRYYVHDTLTEWAEQASALAADGWVFTSLSESDTLRFDPEEELRAVGDDE